MIGPIPLMPIPEIQEYLGDSIKSLKRLGSQNMLQMAMSIAEYMKDAQRWQYVRDSDLDTSQFTSFKEMQEHVDEAIRLAEISRRTGVSI